MVSQRRTVILCDVCGKEKPTKRVRVGWVGGKLRSIDLCEEHAATVDKLLAAVEVRRPSARGIAAIPIMAIPEAPATAQPASRRRRNTPLRATETGV